AGRIRHRGQHPSDGDRGADDATDPVAGAPGTPSRPDLAPVAVLPTAVTRAVVAPAASVIDAIGCTVMTRCTAVLRNGTTGLHVAHDAVAVQALFAEPDRPAMGIATHARGRVAVRIQAVVRR